jgi:hypothetical protein
MIIDTVRPVEVSPPTAWEKGVRELMDGVVDYGVRISSIEASPFFNNV